MPPSRMRAPLVFTLAAASCAPVPTTPPPVVGKCQLPAEAPRQCSGSSSSLGDLPFSEAYFSEVSTSVGLQGALARRVAFGDVNGDRFPDLIGIETGVRRGLQHLYLNLEGNRFVEATAASGITANYDGTDGGQTAMMAVLRDVDNDGDLDLFTGGYSQEPNGPKSNSDPNALYLNDGRGRFELARSSGLADRWPLTTTAASFLDYDLDGKLDLFIGNFMIRYPQYTSYASDLYKGDGAGRFVAVTAEAGLAQTAPVGDESGRFPKPVYAATSCDVNDDAWPDLLVGTYALSLDELWVNQGQGRFVDEARRFRFDMDDQAYPAEPPFRQGGNTFSNSCADYDNDGDLDVFNAETTHGDDRQLADRSRLLRNVGPSGGFAFERPPLEATGIARDLNGTGPNGCYGNEGDHGATWVDLNHDGLLDLIIENSAYPEAHAWIYQQLPDHTFVNVTESSGVKPLLMNSNGISVDDFDRDGDLDLAMGSVNAGVPAPGGVEQLHLFRNEIGNRGHWLYLTLRGIAANRQGVGAKVTLTAGCVTQTREVSGGKGTFGAGDPAYAHFGLGTVARIDRLEIRWPTHPPKVQVLTDLAVDQFLEVTEGNDELSCSDPVNPTGPKQ